MRRPRAGFVAALSAALLAAGCASPSYSYVTNAKDRVYFKVPAAWHRIDQKTLDEHAASGLSASEAAALKASTWSVAFDAAARPSIAHLFASSTSNPVAFSRVVRISPDNRSAITLDFLRDAFLPITATARAQAATNGSLVPPADIRSDKVINRDGFRGVHTVFRISLGGPIETFDQVAYMAHDHSRVYSLVIRCAQACYSDRFNELDPVVRSFTVGSTS
jgi:hypothetical protein